MIRLQGTDGVRRLAIRADDARAAGLSPQAAFLERGVITEQFMELYLFCRARWLIHSGAMRGGEAFVIAWDPRDPEGRFTGAAARGLAKGGARVVSLGVAPTPLAPLYMRHTGAAGASVITASHNPAAYNGIKLFTRNGLKLLPADDARLSAAVLETPWDEVERAVPQYAVEDHRGRALALYSSYLLEPLTSAARDAFARVTLIVDTANGALSPVAGEVLRAAGFGAVICLNNSLDGQVNVRSGVADLEGLETITRGMIEPGGRFENHAALRRLFEEGARRRAGILESGETVAAAVFDGDGDRFYRVEYDPRSDGAFIVTGDGAAALLAAAPAPSPKLFLNTVESDLAASGTARSLGYETRLTAVGDKWILREAFLAALDWQDPAARARLAALGEGAGADDMERELAAAGFRGLAADGRQGWIVGAEESGHIITPGLAMGAGNERLSVFAGDGLKSCLALFSAIEGEGLHGAARLTRIAEPFARGYFKTLYVYYVDKTLWTRGGAVWRDVEAALRAAVAREWPEAAVEEMILPEEPDMLYLKIIEHGAHAATVFIRNSGTEDKTGVNLRGRRGDGARLAAAGEEAARALMLTLKDKNSAMGRAERELLRAANEGGAPQRPVAGLAAREYERLLVETGVKQGLLDRPAPGARLTERGAWYLAHTG